jgi:hypothetical protein
LTRARNEESIDRIGESFARNLAGVHRNVNGEFGYTDSSRVERVANPSLRSASQPQAAERVESNDLEYADRRYANGAARLRSRQQASAAAAEASVVPLNSPYPDVRIEQKHVANRD